MKSPVVRSGSIEIGQRGLVFRIAACLAVVVSAVMSAGGELPRAHADDTPSDISPVHDPCMIKQGTTYYVFSTGDPSVGNGSIQIRTSSDLRHWAFAGTVFPDIPTWAVDAVAGVTNLWAPDISYFKGLYHLYYAVSTFGSNLSYIGLATTPTLDRTRHSYRWTDRGPVLHSDPSDNWNAIDPNLTIDAQGSPWLAFGSFWGGIKLRRMDAATGMLSTRNTTLYALSYRPGSTAVEAASVIYRKPYYYLFVSFDRCCAGVASTYRTMVGRARAITGPYIDRAGNAMMDGGGTQILASQGHLIGQGGGAVMRDGSHYLLVHHYYDGDDNGYPRLAIHALTWTVDGWPSAGALVTS